MRPIRDNCEANIAKPGPVLGTSGKDLLTKGTAQLENPLFCDAFIFGYDTAAGADVRAGDGPFVGNSLHDDALELLVEGHTNSSASTVGYGDRPARSECSVGGNDVAWPQRGSFSGTKFSELPPPERIQRYLLIAEHARFDAAESNDDSVRQSYLFITEQWEKFAVDLALYTARTLHIDRPSQRGPKH